MIWELKDVSRDEVQSFSERYACDPLVAAVLLRRGFRDPADLRYFFDEDLKSSHNPFLFKDMEDAVDRVLQAKAEGEKVLVFGDRDVDGITSTALLSSRLRELGLELDWRVPMGDEHYGISKEVVQNFAAQDGTLLITVDCGITAVEEIDLAKSLGIDTIIIDHHNPQDVIPEALAIINPKMEDSGYPFEGLCGAALVAKFLWALRFGQTSIYKERFTLLHARPGNDSIIIEAIKLENLVETGRLLETIVPGMISLDQSRLVDFLANEVLLVYDEKVQLRLLRQVFGAQTEIGLTDIAPEVHKVFPNLRGVSLLRMLQNSKLARFSSKPPLEIEAFAQLIRSYLYAQHEELFTRHLEDLDLASLGLVADMMPLLNENRILVRHGLQAIERTRRPGLRALLDLLKLLGRPLSSQDLGWKLAPVINSTGRMGKPDLAVRLLMSEDREELASLVKEVVAMNDTRKALGARAWEKIYHEARKSRELNQGKFVLVGDASVHRGITGILAGRLCRELNAPSAVVAFLEDRAVGSIRSARGFEATRFLSNFEDIFHSWGGHDAAGGFSLSKERYAEFESRLPSILEHMYLEEEKEECVNIDLQVIPARMDASLEEIEKAFQPQGQDFGRIVYLCRGALVEDIQFLGKGQEHVKLLLATAAKKWPALMWNSSERIGRDLNIGNRIDLIFNLERNFWGVNQTLQLNVLDFRAVG